MKKIEDSIDRRVLNRDDMHAKHDKDFDCNGMWFSKRIEFFRHIFRFSCRVFAGKYLNLLEIFRIE